MSSTERFLVGKPWADAAKCGELPEAEFDVLFYPDESIPLQKVTRLAKKHCVGCLVKPDCLTDAIMDNDIFVGVRGGLSPRELVRERAARRKLAGDTSERSHRSTRTISKGQY